MLISKIRSGSFFPLIVHNVSLICFLVYFCLIYIIKMIKKNSNLISYLAKGIDKEVEYWMNYADLLMFMGIMGYYSSNEILHR